MAGQRRRKGRLAIPQRRGDGGADQRIEQRLLGFKVEDALGETSAGRHVVKAGNRGAVFRGSIQGGAENASPAGLALLGRGSGGSSQVADPMTDRPIMAYWVHPDIVALREAVGCVAEGAARQLGGHLLHLMGVGRKDNPSSADIWSYVAENPGVDF